jgi:hypothetical protein
MNWDADFAAYHLIVWGGSVAGLTGCEGQNRIDVRVFEIGIFPENRLSRLASRHQAKNVCDRDAQAANRRAAVHAIGIDRYSFQ